MNLPEKIPLFRVRYQPEEIHLWGEDKIIPSQALEKKRIWAFSALARPESFERTLKNLGPELLGFEAFPDHYVFQGKDLGRLIKRATRAGAEALVTTEKDGVRLTDFPRGSIPLWVLSIRHEFLGDDLTRFEAFLFGRLGGKP